MIYRTALAIVGLMVITACEPPPSPRWSIACKDGRKFTGVTEYKHNRLQTLIVFRLEDGTEGTVPTLSCGVLKAESKRG
jgi:hypothetical protein